MGNEFGVNTNDLEGQFEREIGRFERMSEEYVEAFNDYNLKKIGFETEESRLRMLVREELTAQAETVCHVQRAACKTATERGAIRFSKPTGDEISDALRTMPAYIALRTELLEAEVDMKMKKSRADAARFKKDMLTNIGHLHNAHMRHLMPPKSTSDMAQTFINRTDREH